jgi:hypothetical protein
MSSSPTLKVYNAHGDYIAACKHAEDAAALAAFNGNGTTIRHGHKLVVWTEGKETHPAAESFDFVATTIARRTPT